MKIVSGLSASYKKFSDLANSVKGWEDKVEVNTYINKAEDSLYRVMRDYLDNGQLYWHYITLVRDNTVTIKMGVSGRKSIDSMWDSEDNESDLQTVEDILSFIIPKIEKLPPLKLGKDFAPFKALKVKKAQKPKSSFTKKRVEVEFYLVMEAVK